MAERLQNALKKPGSLLVFAGVLGLMLLIFGDAGADPQPHTEGVDESARLEVYGARLEEELQDLVEQIEGAGAARVMITFETTGETIYALDERNAPDGSYQSEHVLAEGQPVSETLYLPPVQGAAVLCQGADNVTVQAKVTETVSVLLGVTSNRISIAKMS